MTTDIDQIIEALIKFRNERDWEQFHNPKDLAIAMNVEAGELLELFLWKKPDQADKKRIKEINRVFLQIAKKVRYYRADSLSQYFKSKWMGIPSLFDLQNFNASRIEDVCRYWNPTCILTEVFSVSFFICSSSSRDEQTGFSR